MRRDYRLKYLSLTGILLLYCIVLVSCSPNIDKLTSNNDIEGLVQALGYDKDEIRLSAYQALKEIADQQALDPLVGMLTNENADSRALAANLLGMIGNDRAVKPLVGLLKDNDSTVRENAAKALGTIGGDFTAAWLISFFDSEIGAERQLAAEILVDIGEPAMEQLAAKYGYRNPDLPDVISDALNNHLNSIFDFMAPFAIKIVRMSKSSEFVTGNFNPHSLVILDSSGAPHSWNNQIPADWLPTKISDVELIVIVGEERKTELSKEEYFGGPPITKYQNEMSVRVMEAKTGNAVRIAILKGSKPGLFPEEAPVEQIEIVGSQLGYEDFIKWLIPTVSQRFLIDQDNKYEVDAIAFSPDGQVLASGSRDYMIRLWRVADGELISTLKVNQDKVTSLAFSPDGQTLASLAANNSIQLWRVSDGRLLHDWRGSLFTFSPDGQILVIRNGNLLNLFRITDGELLQTLSGHTNTISDVDFSLDSQFLASASYDDSVRIWRVSNGELLFVLMAENPDIMNEVTFSPDGSFLATGSADGNIYYWRVVDGELIYSHELEGPRGTFLNGVTSIKFSPKGEIMAACAHYDEVYLYRSSNGELLHILGTKKDYVVNNMAFSPDGQYLAVGISDLSGYFWRVADGTLMYFFDGIPRHRLLTYIPDLVISPDGQFLAMGDNSQNAIRLIPIKKLLNHESPYQ